MTPDETGWDEVAHALQERAAKLAKDPLPKLREDAPTRVLLPAGLDVLLREMDTTNLKPEDWAWVYAPLVAKLLPRSRWIGLGAKVGVRHHWTYFLSPGLVREEKGLERVLKFLAFVAKYGERLRPQKLKLAWDMLAMTDGDSALLQHLVIDLRAAEGVHRKGGLVVKALGKHFEQPHGRLFDGIELPVAVGDEYRICACDVSGGEAALLDIGDDEEAAAEQRYAALLRDTHDALPGRSIVIAIPYWEPGHIHERPVALIAQLVEGDVGWLYDEAERLPTPNLSYVAVSLRGAAAMGALRDLRREHQGDVERLTAERESIRTGWTGFFKANHTVSKVTSEVLDQALRGNPGLSFFSQERFSGLTSMEKLYILKGFLGPQLHRAAIEKALDAELKTDVKDGVPVGLAIKTADAKDTPALFAAILSLGWEKPKEWKFCGEYKMVTRGTSEIEQLVLILTIQHDGKRDLRELSLRALRAGEGRSGSDEEKLQAASSLTAVTGFHLSLVTNVFSPSEDTLVLEWTFDADVIN